MTKKDLKQIKYLNSELRSLREHLQELEAQIGISSMPQDGQPKGNKIGRPVEAQAILLAETITLIREHEKKIQTLKDEIWGYIAGRDDALLRQIIMLRFVDGKSWASVAISIGGNMTPDNCRKIFERSNIDD